MASYTPVTALMDLPIGKFILLERSILSAFLKMHPKRKSKHN